MPCHELDDDSEYDVKIEHLEKYGNDIGICDSEDDYTNVQCILCDDTFEDAIMFCQHLWHTHQKKMTTKFFRAKTPPDLD